MSSPIKEAMGLNEVFEPRRITVTLAGIDEICAAASVRDGGKHGGGWSISVGIAGQLHFDGKGRDAHLAFGGEDHEFSLNTKSEASTVREGHALRFRCRVEFGAGFGQQDIKRNDSRDALFTSA
jgi:hypothetical protein